MCLPNQVVTHAELRARRALVRAMRSAEGSCYNLESKLNIGNRLPGDPRLVNVNVNVNVISRTALIRNRVSRRV